MWRRSFFIPRMAGHGSRRTAGTTELVGSPSLELAGEDPGQSCSAGPASGRRTASCQLKLLCCWQIWEAWTIFLIFFFCLLHPFRQVCAFLEPAGKTKARQTLWQPHCDLTNHSQGTDGRALLLIPSFTVRRSKAKYHGICDLQNTELATQGQQKRLFTEVVHIIPVILRCWSPRVGSCHLKNCCARAMNVTVLGWKWGTCAPTPPSCGAQGKGDTASEAYTG